MAATHGHHRAHPWKYLKRLLVGQPLRNNQLEHQRLRKLVALPVFASDALSSVAYATQEILLVLTAAGAMFLQYMTPVAMLICLLLVILVFSYRQTIFAYPNGGGAYIVAKDNLGTPAGLVAGASLLVDYVLTVSVSIASGVDALASLYPNLHAYSVWISLAFIAIIVLANLRGVRESGALFAAPTYIFVLSVLSMIGIGGYRLLTHAPVLPEPAAVLPPTSHNIMGFALVFLVARAFASGCTALTGVEAISNGVSVFKAPESKNAATTMAAMGAILLTMFLGITWLAFGVHVLPGDQETVLSAVGRWAFTSVPGGAGLHWVLDISTMLILTLAANTSFADFPRLASLMARDGFLPRQFANRGDRLVFTNGIVILGVMAALLIVKFNSNTNALIPLYSIGVFTSFTLSQTGMVMHHLKAKEKGHAWGMMINVVGACLTMVVLVVEIATKFTEGAWIVVVLIPLLYSGFAATHRHYEDVANKLRLTKSPRLEPVHHRVVVPIASVNKMVINTLRYAVSLSPDVTAIYVATNPDLAKKIKEKWDIFSLGVPLEFLASPYRSLTEPIMRYLDKVERQHPHDMVTVVLPEFVPSHFWHHLLHNQSALMLKGSLLFRKHTIVTSVPYHLGDPEFYDE